MGRIFLSLVATLTSAGLMLGAASAQATSCTIENTGGNSNNTCTVSENNNLTVTCKNTAEVVFVNNQNANSGNSVVLENTNGGYAVSGNAQNVNKVDGKLDIKCAPAVAVTPTPTPAPSPTPTPVAAQTTPAGGQGQAAPKAKALPNTGNNTLVSSAIVATAVLGLGAVIARSAATAYRHISLK